MEVRTAGPGDWAEWRDLRLLALATDPAAFASSVARERGYDDERWRQMCAPPAVLAVDGVTPVAMGSGFVDRPGHLAVVAMWTRPEWRGQGIGARVLETITQWALARGLRPHLSVMRGNPDAERLYVRNGFVRTGLEEDYDGRPAIELVLGT